MYLTLFFVSLALFHLVGGSSFAHHCFEPTFHRGISNSPPLAELWDVTPYECLTFCVKRSHELCRSVVYHKHFSSCQIYSHDGTEAPSEIVYADGHDYFNRTSFSGKCESPGQGVPEGQAPEAPAPPIEPAVAPVEPAIPPRPAGPVSSQVAPAVAQTPVQQEKCKAGQDQAYFFVVVHELAPAEGASKTSSIVNKVDQTDCVKLCTANLDQNGDDIKCSSINYYPLEKKCELNEIKSQPHGPGSLIENEDALYIEKFCLPVAKPADCTSDLFVFYVQRHIINANYFLAAFSGNPGSIEDCVGRCVKHESCKSSSYNKAAGEWCTLHSVNLGDEPNANVEGDPGWVFVENGCRILSRQKSTAEENAPPIALSAPIIEYDEVEASDYTEPSSVLSLDELSGTTSGTPQAEIGNHLISEEGTSMSWTDWSPCQFQVQGRPVRVRNKDCKDTPCPDGGLQVEKC